MATLSGQTIANTFDSLLHVEDDTAGLVATSTDSRVIQDGVGANSALALATDSVRITSTNKLYFNDVGGEYISGNASVLSIVGGSEIDLAATAIDINGTVDLSSTLTVAGITTISGTLTVNAAAVFNELSGDNDFRVEGNGNANLLFCDAGEDRVGIGTSAPQNTLHVAGDAEFRTSVGDGAEDRFYFRVGGGSDDSELRMFNSGESQTLHLDTGGITYFNGGNVGIGTSGPDGLLEVSKDDSNLVYISSYHNTGTNYAGLYLRKADNTEASPAIISADDTLGGLFFQGWTNAFKTGAAIEAKAAAGLASGDDLPTDLNFYTADNGAVVDLNATPQMSISAGGNIGIGTTAFSSGVKCLGLLNGTDPGGTTSNTACFFAASGEMNYTDAAGNAATLDSLASDERMKDNITVIPNALSRLQELKGITFNYVSYKNSSLPFKDKIADDVKFNSHNLYGDNIRVGVIAQDVEKAYDGLNITNAVHHLSIESIVEENMKDHVPEIYGDVKKLRVNTLIPLLIEAVKELSAKVEALENA
tara:strand:+ start:594 stop:2195 length:1602 start_codon:yes stop_codon:yes gene_type:complete